MNFIEAIIAISKRDDLEICTDETELDGRHSSICIYKNGSFIGKLRWPKDDKPATVDEELLAEIQKT